MGFEPNFPSPPCQFSLSKLFFVSLAYKSHHFQKRTKINMSDSDSCEPTQAVPEEHQFYEAGTTKRKRTTNSESENCSDSVDDSEILDGVESATKRLKIDEEDDAEMIDSEDDENPFSVGGLPLTQRRFRCTLNRALREEKRRQIQAYEQNIFYPIQESESENEGPSQINAVISSPSQEIQNSDNNEDFTPPESDSKDENMSDHSGSPPESGLRSSCTDSEQMSKDSLPPGNQEAGFLICPDTPEHMYFRTKIDDGEDEYILETPPQVQVIVPESPKKFPALFCEEMIFFSEDEIIHSSEDEQ